MEGHAVEPRLGDLFELEELQRIQDAFASATGVASVIIGLDGDPLTRPSGACRLCAELVQGTEPGRARCRHSYAHRAVGDPADGLHCQSAGLLDGGATICAGTRPLATWRVGQVLELDPDLGALNGFGQAIGADPDRFQAALAEVPRMSAAQFGQVLRALQLIASQLSRQATQNLEQGQHLQERRRAEAVLRERERMLREAQEAGQVGSYDWDMQRDRWISSEVMDGIFGIGHDYPRTLQGWLDRVAPEYRAKLEQHAREVAAGEHPFDLEYPIIRFADQQRRWVHGKGRVEPDRVGRPARLVGTILDITDRREADHRRRELEREIQHAMRVESLGLLAGGIAHDMNNVLGAIQAVCQTLKLKQGEPRDLDSALDLIGLAANRGRDLVKGLTEFVRKDHREPELLDLNAMVREELDLLSRTSRQRIKLVMTLQEPLPRVLGQKGALGSALMNLCVNALDAMAEGGTLTLRTWSLPDAQVVLAVEDTGRGMPPEVLARAKEPFFTTKGEGAGTGLGLAVVQATAKAMGGSMSLRSEPGRGSSVHLYLPVAGPAMGAPLAAPPPAPVSAGRDLLLVDDDELIRISVSALLAASGHRVRIAAGGAEGLSLVASGEPLDLIILDLNMPGMNGAETLKALRLTHPRLPVLLATGYLDANAEALVKADPWLQTLAKPFLLEDLNAMIGNLLKG